MPITQTMVGKDLYVFTSKLAQTNTTCWLSNPNCIIDSHGLRVPTKTYFNVPRGVRIHFYVHRHAAMVYNEVAVQRHYGPYNYVSTINDIARGRAHPPETIRGPQRCPDYLLSKQTTTDGRALQPRYDDIGYDDLKQYLECHSAIAEMFDLVSVRNRAGRHVYLSNVLQSLGKHGYAYADIHCSFCRGGVTDSVKDMFGAGRDERVGGHPV